MPLLEFYKNNKDTVLSQTIIQIVHNAGNGDLRDNSVCSNELREFLSLVQHEQLKKYTDTCLESAFSIGGVAINGFVLQDLVNEIGRRLGYTVENGLYRGVKNQVGFDGIWKAAKSSDLIVEVKTTEAYTIDLDKLFEYKRKLELDGRVNSDSKILIIVGRKDTNALEAQVRGSRYAWDTRIISVESLYKLVSIALSTGDIVTVSKIRQLLQPFEYTRLDSMIDVIFDTIEDVKEADEKEVKELTQDGNEFEEKDNRVAGGQIRTDKEIIDETRSNAIEALANKLGKTLTQTTKTLFTSSDNVRVCCPVSKRYNRNFTYWYAYHPNWRQFLTEGSEGFLVLGCVGLNKTYAIPSNVMEANLDNLNISENENGKMYWHLHINDNLDELFLKHGEKLSLSEYVVAFDN